MKPLVDLLCSSETNLKIWDVCLLAFLLELDENIDNTLMFVDSNM